MTNGNHEFDTTDVLTRIVTPFASALIALSQFPGTEIGNWFLVAVLALGLFISFNQTIEMFDRRYNTKLYEMGLA